MLAESSEFNEVEGPCLAFRRAASVLKSLPWTVRCLGAAQDLPCLGEHTKAVIEVRARVCRVQLTANPSESGGVMKQQCLMLAAILVRFSDNIARGGKVFRS